MNLDDLDPDLAEAALDRAEDAYLRRLVAETADPLGGPDDLEERRAWLAAVDDFAYYREGRRHD